MRRVQVNAKITFAIWVLETISLAVIFFVSRIWQNYEFLITYGILILHVVLPFTFLTNSSENKKRLVDAKVIDILLNIFGVREHKTINPSPNIATIPVTTNANYIREIIPRSEVVELSKPLQNPFKGKKHKDHGEIHCIVHSNFLEHVSHGASDTLHVTSTSHGCVFSESNTKKFRTKR